MVAVGPDGVLLPLGVVPVLPVPVVVLDALMSEFETALVVSLFFRVVCIPTDVVPVPLIPLGTPVDDPGEWLGDLFPDSEEDEPVVEVPVEPNAVAPRDIDGGVVLLVEIVPILDPLDVARECEEDEPVPIDRDVGDLLALEESRREESGAAS